MTESISSAEPLMDLLKKPVSPLDLRLLPIPIHILIGVWRQRGIAGILSNRRNLEETEAINGTQDVVIRTELDPRVWGNDVWALTPEVVREVGFSSFADYFLAGLGSNVRKYVTVEKFIENGTLLPEQDINFIKDQISKPDLSTKLSRVMVDESTMKARGRAFSQILKDAGVTQAVAATRGGVSQPWVSSLLKGSGAGLSKVEDILLALIDSGEISHAIALRYMHKYGDTFAGIGHSKGYSRRLGRGLSDPLDVRELVLGLTKYDKEFLKNAGFTNIDHLILSRFMHTSAFIVRAIEIIQTGGGKDQLASLLQTSQYKLEDPHESANLTLEGFAGYRWI